MVTPIEQYILDHISPEAGVLKELDRATHLKILQPRMLSGHLQGELLKMLVEIINPKRVLELGTFTGYSAVCMARGLGEGAHLHTIEIDDELESIATEFIEKAGVRDKVVQYFGSALDVVPRICDEPFDVIFIDADKREYTAYYQMIMSCGAVRKGTIILADNVLWNGKVVEEVSANDLYTQGVLNFNKMVVEDCRVEKIILPLRDGLSIIRVK
ncbi:O-methyltransferase family protein [C1] [Mucinivorans hirudinis]|uniref:O-methyltransferase family protein [C1] n=1 Tax=Mucinivorans hirudinis TaxID=1433126 RepID=A0A060R5R0_9BACT|nr:O-methyltransferase family protein [C1] [Mucinivorans hirudinis]